MSRTGCIVAFSIALVFAAQIPAQQAVQQPPSSSIDDVKREIQRLDQEIAALRQSPQAPAAWQEMQKLEAQLKAMKQERQREQEPLSLRLQDFRRTSAVQEWEERIDKLVQRLNGLHAVDYQQIRVAGRRLFQARHAELARNSPAETPQLRGLGLGALNYPRVDGSTSTQPLAVLIACRCFGAPYAWEGREQKLPRSSRYDRAVPVSDLDLYLEREYDRGEPELALLEFSLRAQGTTPTEQRLALIINRLLATNASTHQAYVNLIEGTSELGLLARPPSSDELRLARSRGVELDVAPCALDAFVFLVNERNSVRNLTTAQIQGIYSSQVMNWKAVGGSDRSITPYVREENSGSQELMKSLVMKEVPIEIAKRQTGPSLFPTIPVWPPQLVGYGMIGTFLELTDDENGIGFSVYYYEHFMSGSPRTRTIAVDGVEPSFENIRQRKYPFVSDVLVVTRQGIDPASPARRLRDWLLSREGQAVVRESGYVPVGTGRER